jgi:hypothetical protein
LWEKVADLNFQDGLDDLSQKMRAQLEREGNPTQTTDEVMAELNKMREDITTNDYRKSKPNAKIRKSP